MDIRGRDHDRARHGRNTAPIRADFRRVTQEPASHLRVALICAFALLGLFVIADRWVMPRLSSRDVSSGPCLLECIA